MASIDNLLDTKPMQALQKAGAFMQNNAAFSAISGGMMGTMGLVLAGAIFTIISTLLNLAGVLETTDPIYQWLQLPYNMTMGIMAIAAAFGVAYAYTNNLKMKGAMANGFVAMFMFMMVCSPVQTVTLEGGTTMTAIDTTYLGGTGLFTALIMPLIVVRIIKVCADKHVAIRMPDVVPQFLSDSFSSLVPLVINIVLFCGLNTLLENTMGANIPAAVMGILSLPLAALTSGPGVIVLVFIAMLFWSMGLHGSAIAYIVVMAPIMATFQENAALVAAGQEPVFDTVLLFMVGGMASAGGTGNVLPLAIHCMRAKSQQLRAIGKAGVIPAIFNISEPMVFGVPIMLNPIIMIPFILNVVITVCICWAGFAVGFFKVPYVMLMTVLPMFFGEFLGAMAWQNLLIPVIAFVVAFIVYAPFVAIYDKQCLEREEAEAAEEAAAQQA